MTERSAVRAAGGEIKTRFVIGAAGPVNPLGVRLGEAAMLDGKFVLVVDDEPNFHLFVSDVLEAHGFHVLMARSADEALGVLSGRGDIEAVITDVMMPGTLDGLGLVSEIRRRWPTIRTVVASGRLPASAAGNAPGTVFLAKPFDDQALLAALKSSVFSAC